MIHVLTKSQWEALMEILGPIELRTLGGSLAAVLVAPEAAQKYYERTDRRIGDTGGALAYEFESPSIMLELVYSEDIEFADSEDDVANPYVVQCILETQNLCGDARSRRTAHQE